MWVPKIASLALERTQQPYCWASFRSATLAAVALIVAFWIFLYILKRPRVYLVDYSCVKYGDEHKASLEVLQYFMEALGTIGKRDIAFQLKVFLKSGIGEEAYVPRRMLEKGRVVDLQNLEEQSRILIVGAVDEVLKKTGVMPAEVDIVIVNTGMYNPTPSLTAWLVNHFNMRTDVKTFHLAGMGCSAGLIAVDLAKDLLYSHRDKYAVIASSEVLQYMYDGKERSMMVTNCLFRCAGSALLLSNKEREKSRAKLELLHLVRVNTAAQDDAHNCVVVKEDSEGVCGAELAVKLVEVASDALRINIQRLAPKVLPVSELLKAGWNLVERKVLRMKMKQYVPNFKLAFEHFCIHPGGKAVIEGVGKSLKLSQYDIEPSLMALRRFGNTSCAGVWYILAYCEAKKRLKRGDRVWQIGLGSGFKCTTGVWRVMRSLDGSTMAGNPWNDCIHRYPVGEMCESKHVQSLIELLNKRPGSSKKEDGANKP